MQDPLIESSKRLAADRGIDVLSVISSQGDLSAEDQLKLLLADQQRRWAAGDPLSVESYLSRLSELGLNEAVVIELAAAEFAVRQRMNLKPTLEEFVLRFPHVAERLQNRIAELARVDGDPTQTMSPERLRQQVQTSYPGMDPDMNNSESMVGRYRRIRDLGSGAFGVVFLAFDEELHRLVAIKVPSAERFRRSKDVELFLAEARTVASLNHPNIVPVYDVGRTQDGAVFVVSRFIEGCTLREKIQSGRLSFTESCQLIQTVARALQEAHNHRVIHRDIKPENILIEASTGTPFVADFGLAMREEDYAKQAGIAGTPAYMSPEQARGEGHRLDGRSDQFSLGVILYEMITGKRPFAGSSPAEVLHMVVTADPVLPRRIQPDLPAELERICLKAMNKQASSRYSNVSDFADDLDRWLDEVSSEPSLQETHAAVVPKGLRSFDAGDAGFFLDLLPGQKDRSGLPESVAFWKKRIEERDPEQSFGVGLIFGPSGCGKSSLVKAGLLPHLSKDVIAVYLEATPEETELRILRGLKKRLAARFLEDEAAAEPHVARGGGAFLSDADSTGKNAHPSTEQSLMTSATSLKETLLYLRRNGDQKIVIIIDQFEQWLHTHRAERDAELVQALRQCDGIHVQAIVMVRDDFAMAAARFMQALDVAIVQGQNFATVDLFECDHAKFVLIKFGQAFGKLPVSGDLTNEEQQFIDDVANGLAQDGKIVSVRLSLFAEMVKSKRWIPETLKAVGGTEGIGVNFLEETFSSPQANPRHRLHAAAARAVLKSLLPELGTDIKGHMRSQEELLEASGYVNRPSDFADLLKILDSELRLITPTDPEGDPLSGERQGVSPPSSSSPGSSPSALRFYQLTHDYLVPSLREWLSRKQRESRKGRAELKLEERTALWTARPENRHLPSLGEWISIRWLTDRKLWTAGQREVMNQATKIHGLRTSMTIVGIGLIITVAIGLNRQADERRNQAEATRLVEGLLAANTAKISDSLASLQPFRLWATDQLEKEFQDAAPESDAKLHAGLALLSGGNHADPPLIKFLQDRLLSVTPGQIGPVRELMVPQKSLLIPAYWSVAQDTAQAASLRFRAACCLARFDADSSEWKNLEFTTLVANQLVSVSPEHIGDFKELLRPVAPHLVPALTEIFKDPLRGELARTLSTSLLADYAAQDSDTLTELVLAADSVSDRTLFPVLKHHQTAVVENLEAVLDCRPQPDWKDQPLDPTWIEPTSDVRSYIESAHGLIFEQFAFCQDMPVATFLDVAESLRRSGYRPTRIRPVVEASEQSLSSVSALWTRDSKRWHIDIGLRISDIPSSESNAAKDGLLLDDVAPLPMVNSEAEPQFIALWSEPASSVEQRRTLLDVSDSNLKAAESDFIKQGYSSQHNITVRTDSKGNRRYTAIWSNQPARSENRLAYAGFELMEQPQWDVAAAPEARSKDPLEKFSQQLAELAALPPEKRDQPQVRETRAIANYELGSIDKALTDLDFLVSNRHATPLSLKYRSLALARLRRTDEARMCLSEYLATDADHATKVYVQIQALGWQGDFEQASMLLESAAKAAGQNSNELYKLACAAALCAKAAALDTPVESSKFSDRSFELLLALVARGNVDAEQLQSDVDLSGLGTDPRMREILSRLITPAAYAAVWRADLDFESKLLHRIPRTLLLEKLRPWLHQGWRPFAIAVATSHGGDVPDKHSSFLLAEQTDKAQSGLQQSADNLLCTLVLHRPLVPETVKEALAVRQAAAATTLLKMNQTRKIWPLFEDQQDSRLRTFLMHRLTHYGVSPQCILDQLHQEGDLSRQRSLIVSLGDFARSGALSADQKKQLAEELVDRYSDDPDSGIHGAVEWALRQMSESAAVDRIREVYSTGTVVGERHWYLTNAHGQSKSTPAIQFAIINPAPEFLMGSPITERSRFGGPTGKNEIRHRRRIGRRYAISTHEITIAQFQAFRSEHEFDRSSSRELDSPANMITWYEAAEFCNWLSKEQGIPIHEWCYDPDGQFSDGMKLVPDYLRRTGYRLPSEAEWEYACRAGTVTARYFGESDAVMSEYARYSKDESDDWTLPVGSLKPNSFGLFDMQGNVLEWCQDEAEYYRIDRQWMDDEERLSAVLDSKFRIPRGGSFAIGQENVRSAYRNVDTPGYRTFKIGFRVARTLP